MLRRYFKHHIGVVRYCHELRERGATEDGMVGYLEVGDDEVDILNSEVVLVAELYWERNLSH